MQDGLLTWGPVVPLSGKSVPQPLVPASTWKKLTWSRVFMCKCLCAFGIGIGWVLFGLGN
jgi:hypothetical protein